MRILIIEDSPTERELLQTVLEYAHFRVEAVATKDEATSKLDHNEYDFVILDYVLDEPDASAVLARDIQSRKIPCVVFTGMDREDISGLPLGMPVWRKEVGLRMDLVTKICDYYRTYTDGVCEKPGIFSFLGR